MTYKISAQQLTFESSRTVSFASSQPSITLHSRVWHVVINFFHTLFPRFFKNHSTKVELNANKVVYVSAKSYQAWRTSQPIVDWAKSHHLILDGQEIAKEIKQILRVLTHVKFKSQEAEEIIQAMEGRDHEGLKALLEKKNKAELRALLLEQDPERKATLLAYAAHHNHLEAVDLLTAAMDQQLLHDVLIKKDKHQWTALHHLALMNDGGKRYKELKKKGNVDAKRVSEFLCESPYMLRKYIRVNAGRFSTLSEKRPMQIYFKKVNHQAKEQHLMYDDFSKKYGKHFSRKPDHFKSIPQLKAEYIQSLWETLPDKIEKNKSRLLKLDHHLKAILSYGEESGICLARIKYNDKGEKLPEEIDVGIGAQARRDFKCNDIVTLYAGEYFNEKHPKPSDFPTSDYAFGSELKETIEALKVRSYGSSFIHSAPNIRFEQIASIFGFTILSMTANEDIKKDDQLCLSYGPKYFESRHILPLETRPAAREQMQKHPASDSSAKWTQECYLKVDARLD